MVFDVQNADISYSGFKFLPVLGNYTVLGMQKKLLRHLAEKWGFRMDYRDQDSAFKGDGSRGGPLRRELRPEERAKL